MLSINIISIKTYSISIMFLYLVCCLQQYFLRLSRTNILGAPRNALHI